MAIKFEKENQLFILQTKSTSYQIKIGPYQTLLHLYYGKRVDSNLDYLIRMRDRSHCSNPYEAEKERGFSMETQLQEYSTFGVGDYNSACLEVHNVDGSCAVDLRYESHEIKDGKYKLNGLPHVYDSSQSATQTLIITCSDKVTHVKVKLYYGVMEEYDVITRAAVIQNNGENSIELTKALSACVDFPNHQYDLIHFYGKHCREREYDKIPIGHTKVTVESTRGLSSHHHNPFVILTDKNTTEVQGGCYGFCFLYSGNFITEVDVSQIGQTRLVMGIHPAFFRYEVKQGESFVTPEVIMSYSANGLEQLSHNFHKVIREHVCRGMYKTIQRPVLINNWEATYFDFNTKKLVEIAKEASELGIDMLVMDDGWFGKRKDDYAGLGDWVVNTKKLGTTLEELVCQINAVGCKFGIWFEPEMVNEESDLYKIHPDWCLTIPGRTPTRCRYQLVLDLSRKDVREHIYESLTSILNSANIEYVKWDFNRSIAEVWSAQKDAMHQGQVFHDYILGLYEILERLVTNYPKVLFEGCSSGGGRFDAGMLFYMPQIWCSDNTDAYDRLKIQYGTSFCYPISSIGSHVSAVPNHQTGRTTPLNTRGVVAMAGTFGYELDINKLTKEEKGMIKEQVVEYKQLYQLINQGEYYRLTSPYENQYFTAWQFVSQDKVHSLVHVVFHSSQANANFYSVMLRGLDLSASYQVSGRETAYSGAALMFAGLELPDPVGDYQAFRFLLTRIQC